MKYNRRKYFYYRKRPTISIKLSGVIVTRHIFISHVYVLIIAQQPFLLQNPSWQRNLRNVQLATVYILLYQKTGILTGFVNAKICIYIYIYFFIIFLSSNKQVGGCEI